ncbi:MAG: hypothetical protein KJ000_14290 [Pirellulaceae bacterium]|nr:hypothetical protein [Pirellulaceae bacterium]
MKGMQGLIVAGLLGVLGVALNWIYLQGKTKDVATIRFLGIKAGTPLEAGQVIREEHLEAVPVPALHAGNLKDYVYLYDERGTVVGITATRRYQAGDLMYRQDYRTPPAELKLAPHEKLIWIPVNSSGFVPELVDPGDRIEFVIPVYESQPLPAGIEEGMAAASARRVVRTESIGPFRVGSLGSRLASRDVARGNRLSTSQERLVGIVVSQNDQREVDNATNLQARILSGDFRDISVALLEKRKL